jgi:hypothetical protein
MLLSLQARLIEPMLRGQPKRRRSLLGHHQAALL